MGHLLEAVRRGRASLIWDPVKVERAGRRLVVPMTRDAVRVGGLRDTCTAYEAQLCADELEALLPTAVLLDHRHEAAPVQIDPQPKFYKDGIGMSAPAAVEAHNERINIAIRHREGMVSPVGKHWILDGRASSSRAVLYGWHVPTQRYDAELGHMVWQSPEVGSLKVTPSVSGADRYVVQNVSTAHGYSHHDYSMSLCLCGNVWELEGKSIRGADVLTDPELCSLVLYAGKPLASSRLPGVPLEAPQPPDTLPDGGTSPMPEANTLAAAVYARARADLERGIYEDLGRNDGTRIREYCQPFGIRPPLNWCAVGTSTWILEACADFGRTLPIVAGSFGARALMAQFKAIGRFVAAADIVPELHLIPGNVIGWRRGAINDPKEWRGHVGIVAGKGDGRIVPTIEPNSGPRGDRVAASPWHLSDGRTISRMLNDPRLIGIGLCTTFEEALGAPAAADPEPSEHELAEAARLMKLGAELLEDGEPRDPLADLMERIG